MAEKTWKCLGECKREFKPGDWECFAGVAHKVESKEYYMADAPHLDVKNDPNGIALRHSRTQYHCIPETLSKDSNGQSVRSSYRPAEFVMGRYDTDDPKYQYFIEIAKPPMTCSKDRWFEVYHTPLQKQNMKDADLRKSEVELKEKLAEANSLLEQLKAKNKAKDSKEAMAAH